MDLEEVAYVCALELRRRRKRRKQQFWVHPITRQRSMKGVFYILYEDLRCHPKKFFNYYRMSVNSFDELTNNNIPEYKVKRLYPSRRETVSNFKVRK
jgi:hypothetical protein